MRPRRWPDVFLVGAAKSGTTSLYRSLQTHPDIFTSPVKEPHYFSRVRPAPQWRTFHPVVQDELAYLALFETALPQQRVCEASTSYLWQPATAARIHAASPDASIVVILRHPVDRAYSDYWNGVREGLESRSFDDAVSDELATPTPTWGVTSVYVDCGRYGSQLERYLELFGPERVVVLFFEEFVQRPSVELRRLYAALGVDSSQADSVTLEVANAFALPSGRLAAGLVGSGAVRRAARALLPQSVRHRAKARLLRRSEKPPMAASMRGHLEELYAPEIARLEDLLGRPLSPWPGTMAERDGSRTVVA